MDVFSLFAKISLDTSEYDRGLEEASGKTHSFGGKLKAGLATAAKAGAVALGAATTAVGLFAKSSIDAGMSFDAGMSKVGAISGAASGDLERLRDKALEMGSSTKFSATEAADAMNYMAMAGWKTEDMLGGIEGIMHLAAASGEDLATTSDIVTDALTAFGLSASDSGHFADILAVASSNANTNVGMMGETFKYVAPLAGALGYSADDTALAIGLMANAGVKASQAGTALRSIFTRLSTDAGASSKSLGALGTLTQELGVEFYNADGSTREFVDVLMDARGAWQGLSEEQQVNYATTIAGQEAMSGWLAMMNAAPGDVEKLTSAIENADGAAADMAGMMTNNLSGDLTIFRSALEGLQISISDKLSPSLRDATQFATGLVTAANDFIQSGGVEKAIQWFKDLSPVIATATNAFIAFKAGMAIQGAVQGLQNAKVAISLLSLEIGNANLVQAALNGTMTIGETVVALLTGKMSLAALAQGAMTKAQAALNAVLSANPIGIVITLIGLLIGAFVTLYTTNEDFRNKVNEVWNTVKTTISGVVNAIVGFFTMTVPNGIRGLITAFENMWRSITTTVGNIKTTIINGISVAVDWIKSLPSQALNWGKDMISGFVDGIKSKASSMVDAVKNVGKGIRSNLHFSRPDEGPLRDYETWMPDFMKGLASGIRSNTWRGEDALGSLTSQMQMDMSAPFSASITANGQIGGEFASLRSGTTYGDIHIAINGAQYSSEQSLARAIAQELQFMTQRGNAFAPA